MIIITNLREQISSLKIEGMFSFGKFYVKKKGIGEYCLFDTSNKTRSRWGTLDQIVNDTEYAIEYDTLPIPGERW